MPKGDQDIDGLPFRAWNVTVDKYNRVRFPLDEVRSLVPWLPNKNTQFECLATPGSSGGVELFPSAERQKDIDQFAAVIRELPAPIPPGKWLNVARLIATAWLIKLNIEANRVTITLPEAARKAKQLPQAGGVAVVFATAGILEIWDAPNWYEHIRKTATNRAAIMEAIEELGQG